MDELPKEYTLLFNGISSAITELQALSLRLDFLQQQAEEIYISKSASTEQPIEYCAG